MFQMFRPQMFPLDPRCSHCKMNENMVWTDSQDHGEDEILHTSKTMLFHKTTRFISEILTLFRVPPQLFHRPCDGRARRLAAADIRREIVRRDGRCVVSKTDREGYPCGRILRSRLITKVPTRHAGGKIAVKHHLRSKGIRIIVEIRSIPLASLSKRPGRQ